MIASAVKRHRHAGKRGFELIYNQIIQNASTYQIGCKAVLCFPKHSLLVTTLVIWY